MSGDIRVSYLPFFRSLKMKKCRTGDERIFALENEKLDGLEIEETDD